MIQGGEQRNKIEQNYAFVPNENDSGQFFAVASWSTSIVILSSNPLTPKSDKHLISPYNITNESNIKVARIKEMITS